MSDSIWKQPYSNIEISIKRFGIWWSFWQETYYFGDGQGEFFQKIKNKYIKKFKDKPFRMTLIYPNMERTIK